MRPLKNVAASVHDRLKNASKDSGRSFNDLAQYYALERWLYPTILDYPAPVLRAYNRETAIAEKFEAMVSLGRLNSRMKDFFDIWLMATTSDFRGADLHAAISATFRRRDTAITPEPQAFASDFALDPSKQPQWAGFLKRMRPSEAPAKFSDTVDLVRSFLQPINAALVANASFSMDWKHPGP
jgi:hypothetical protein